MGVLLSLPLGLEEEEDRGAGRRPGAGPGSRPGPGPRAGPGSRPGAGSRAGPGAGSRPGAGPRAGSGSRARAGAGGRGRRPYSRRVFRNRTSYLSLSEEQCVRRLGFTREAVTELCHLVQAQLQPRTRAWTALPVAVKVTVALNFYTTGSFQAATGLINDITQFAIHCCIRDVTEVLYAKRNQFIFFPMGLEKQEERAMGFSRMAGFPRVQGVIDCTHIALRAPYQDPGIYINRKGFHSLNVQLVCDHRQRVMQVCARYPGSTQNSFILRQSSIPPLFHTDPRVSGWLLGDKGYPLSTWLMTPVRRPRTAGEKNYNWKHSSTSTAIRRTVSQLKQRFRCLSRSGGSLQYSPDRVSKFIVVCCMLHNFALQRGQALETAGEGDMCEEEEEDEEEEEEEQGSPNHNTARALRQQIIEEGLS
ncbi:putative nuclease HARBI1 [Heptranchias perlo]|uniref:putative nuclease HARBI1 n=1 Tax=Heptranchias perlo TaxID=212740 RepID=UPI003559A967